MNPGSPPVDPDAGRTAVHSHVRAIAAPVLQLLYAHYYLSRSNPEQRQMVPDWQRRLLEREPELVAELRAGAQQAAMSQHMFSLACELDYWGDPDNSRFIAELPDLPGKLLEQMQAGTVRELQADLEQHLHELSRDPAQWVDQLGRLREALKGEWRATGSDTVRAHCVQFEAKLQESGDVIKALPSYHFIRFEKAATRIRSAAEDKDIIVVPLYFASAGGFSFDSGGRRFVGFGLASESLFEDTRAKTEREARGIKALADPTRLLLLTLIGRYSGFDLTVGDLAQYLEVSQPTVSGHLKVLRESGLVDVERQGNRSLYRPNAPAIRELLAEIGGTLLPH